MTEEEYRSERKKLGNRIRAIREHRGLIQLELGVSAKIDKSEVSKYESGVVNLAYDTLKRIAHALQVEIYDLTNYDGPLPDNAHFKSDYPKKQKNSHKRKRTQ